MVWRLAKSSQNSPGLSSQCTGIWLINRMDVPTRGFDLAISYRRRLALPLRQVMPDCAEIIPFRQKYIASNLSRGVCSCNCCSKPRRDLFKRLVTTEDQSSNVTSTGTILLCFADATRRSTLENNVLPCRSNDSLGK